MDFIDFMLLVFVLALGIAVNTAVLQEQEHKERDDNGWGHGTMSPDSDDPSEESWRWDRPAP